MEAFQHQPKCASVQEWPKQGECRLIESPPTPKYTKVEINEVEIRADIRYSPTHGTAQYFFRNNRLHYYSKRQTFFLLTDVNTKPREQNA